jgi:hypothetical protein
MARMMLGKISVTVKTIIRVLLICIPVCSVGVTLGKLNSGTVLSEGKDVRLQFQLRGIYRSPLTKQNVFFSQCITLA